MKRAFGATGAEVARIGQGTWDVPERGAGARAARDAVRRGLALGMTHIDTAEMYGAGAVETWLGEVLRGLPREHIFVTSKVLPSHASYRATLAACDRSLQRLRLEHLDAYLLHWPSDEPLEETMRALESLVIAGKARFIGVSNFDADAMHEARSYLRSVPLACNQVLYHLWERGIEHDLVPQARAAGTAIVGYTPFGRRALPPASSAAGAVLARVAAAHGVSPRAVVLAFLTREPHLFAIPKASCRAHVEENAAALDLTLSAQDIAAIDAAFPRGAPRMLATL